MRNIPAVAILGPRQCGKSTIAKKICSEIPQSIYLDLEYPPDLNKLTDPAAFFELNKDKLICLDEIQRTPEIFRVLRGSIDRNNRNGQFLVLGSASRNLIKQTSESLAGRISFFELTPFLLPEIENENNISILRNLWFRGGFPRSYLAAGEDESFKWRLDFIRTFLERDIPQLGLNLPVNILQRFWQMCAHISGQLLNSSKLGESLGVSYHTIRSYMDILEQTFIIRQLHPFEINVKKRLVKSPKIYVRDTGILHALLDIKTQNDLLGHPVCGSSWEGFVIENILSNTSFSNAGFYRTSSGSEIDLIIQKSGKRIAVECKVSTAPKLSKGFYIAVSDLDIDESWIISPVTGSYPIGEKIFVSPLDYFIERFK